MAAVQGARNSSSVVGVVVVAVAAALLVGGASGYVVRALSTQVSTSSSVALQSQVKATEGHVPTWLQSYNAHAAAPQFKVDELIEGLNYVRPAELPAWVQRYTTPAALPQFNVDEFIASLG